MTPFTSPLIKKRILPLALFISLVTSGSAWAESTFTVDRKPVSKGAYELVYDSPQALYVATSGSRKLDKGGVLYRLDPATLNITQTIKNELKPFGLAMNKKTGTLFLGNTVNSAITAVDAKSGKEKGSLVLDKRPRTETERPLAPRELAVDERTNTVYMGGLGEQSVVWVIDGATLQLRKTIEGLGKYATGLALDSAASRLYVTNADNEFITIDTKTDAVLSRVKLDADADHFYLNIALDPATHRAFVTDSKSPQLLVVDTAKGKVLQKIDLPVSLAVLFNPTRHEIYVTHREAGKVSVIDAKTYNVLHTIDTPVHPNSLALSDDGQSLFVSVKQASSKKQEASAPDDVVRIKFVNQ
ncbi:YncE family protein [Ewingella americana]|uniref:YncE family protein n=1 Tax=Ewingella americana TaxID=41202 RepID=A0A502GQG0_9GAMM|nr:YncE family protein [Ewingella americana]TPG63153.1 YncE family protein [Ewingella americana]